MASDQVRKKWNTIFMGEREATVQELDAMQEPVRRERQRQQQQEDYLARVRAKAEERAREILGAAYAERQKVLDEARVEARALSQQLTRDAEVLKAQSLTALTQVETERAALQALREDAEKIRDAAHDEGFQTGMEQAGTELKEFRAELGQTLGGLLGSLDAQRSALCAFWRDELADLTRVAVEAGTGWLLETEHKRILHALVLQSLNLLEDRSTISLRVHPDDEASVGDLFQAARERVPELSQWIVRGDASIERGGFVAESASGSVDNRREHYREMVDHILGYLALPSHETEEQDTAEASAMPEHEVGRTAVLAPADEHASVPEPLTPEAEEALSRAHAPLDAEAAPQEEAESAPEHCPPLAEAVAAAQPAEATPAVIPHKDNPSLAELEDELFPVSLEEYQDVPEISPAGVFSRGGFLPGSNPEKAS